MKATQAKPQETKPIKTKATPSHATERELSEVSMEGHFELSPQLVLVRQLYEAFTRGDIAYILDNLHPDFRCQIMGKAGIPYAGEYNSSNIGRLFRWLSDTYEFEEFRPERFFENGSEVIIKGYMKGIALGTGNAFDGKWVLAIEFRENKLVFLEDYVDTLQAYKAMIS
jgi:ketosteroid isomerase-like protein